MNDLISRRLPWSFLGVLVTLVLGLPAIYFTIREKTPDISFEILSESNVLDLHRPVKDLTIFFRGVNIQEEKENLRIFTINVHNCGQVTIRQNDFDQMQPWGLRFENAQVVDEPRVIEAKSAYIEQNIKPRVISNNLVEFEKIIFEKGEYFTLEVQTLHSITEEPRLVPVGKLAGLKKQQLVKYSAARNRLPLLFQVFYGPFPVQILRVSIFLVGTFVLIVFLALAVRKVFVRRNRIKSSQCREKEEAYLQPLLRLSSDQGDKRVIDNFMDMYEGDAKKLQRVSDTLKNQQLVENAFLALPTIRALVPRIQEYMFYPDTFPWKMIEKQADGTYSFEQKGTKLLGEIINYLRYSPKPDGLFEKEMISIPWRRS